MNYKMTLTSFYRARFNQGWDYGTTPDFRLSKGSPFSFLESVSYLQELGMDQSHPIM